MAYSNFDDPVTFARVMAEKLSIMASPIEITNLRYPNFYLGDRSQLHAEVKEFVELGIKRAYLQIWMDVLARGKTTETQSLRRVFPLTWWDHLKMYLRYEAEWSWIRSLAQKLLSPPEYKTVEVEIVNKTYHVCPHLPPDPKQKHVEFMYRCEDSRQ